MNIFFILPIIFITSFVHASELKELEHVLYQKNVQNEMPADPIAFRQPVNDILNALNRDWSVGDKTQLAKEFVQLWQRKHLLNSKDRHGLLDTPRVRIQLAGLLGMTARICLDSVSNDELRQFILLHTQSSNISERALSIRMLGYVGSEQDISFLSTIVEQEMQGVSIFAVLSLETLHNKDAIDELFLLEKKVITPELKAFISDRLRSFKEGGTIQKKACN